MTAALRAGEVERARVEETRQQRAASRHHEALELIGARQELAERLRQSQPDGRRLLPENRPAGRGLRAQLEHLRDDVLASRSEEHLAQLRIPADALLASVLELHAQDELARAATVTAAERAREQQSAARQQERQRQADEKAHQSALKAHQAEQKRAAAAQGRQQAAQRATQRAEATKQLRIVRDAAKHLEKLYSRSGAATVGQRPFDVLCREIVLGKPLLEFEPADEIMDGDGFAARVLNTLVAASGQGTWQSPHDPTVWFAGSRENAGPSNWGADTRRVLEAPLRQLHAHEDHLQLLANAQPRRRPQLRPVGAAAL
jgi:hypothetical protein